jgi:AraC-like DNA-binding protein
MVLHLRNMESKRCISLVKNELCKLGLQYKSVELGEVELVGTIPYEKLQLIDLNLRVAGLELIADKKTILLEKIKSAVHQLIYLSDDLPKPIFSDYIRKEINLDYNSISHFFSGAMGVTIEKYIIAQKIERVKELLVCDHLSLNDIAYKLQYSSVAHLSHQFKKVTGLTPSFFKDRKVVASHM